MSGTMSALVGGVGPDWEVHELAVPTPGPGQILVRVRAAGVNRADLYMLEGSYSPNTKTSNVYTAGLEMAGEVAVIGPDVTSVAIGDRVCAAGLGAFGEYAVLDHRHAIAMPESLSWSDAAALPVGLATEHDALVTQAGFTAGDTVLVVGAATAIGLIAVQLAKAFGASLVVATTTSDAKKDALVGVGADVVVKTTTESLHDAVLDATGGAGVDVVLDHVGGDLFAQTLGATRIGGTIVNIGRLGGPGATIDLNQLSFRRQPSHRQGRPRDEGAVMITDELRERRLAIVREHMDTEVTQEFDATLATFDGHPHYEIMATGQIHDGNDEVMGYYLTTRTAFPDQRHDNARFHVSDDAVIVEFDLLGTNLGEFYGMPPTGKAFRVPMIAVFFFDGDRIINERIYFDTASLVTQIGRGELLALAGNADD